jgi:hypothetical protein
MQTARRPSADRLEPSLGIATPRSPGPLVLHFTVKATRARQTRIVERMRFEGPGILIEQGPGSELLLLDSIEDLAIVPNPPRRRPDGRPSR